MVVDQLMVALPALFMLILELVWPSLLFGFINLRPFFDNIITHNVIKEWTEIS